MTDTFKPAHAAAIGGWLERAGRVWKLPIHVGEHCMLPVDDLFLGDRLHFLQTARTPPGLLLKVVFGTDRTLDGQRAGAVYRLGARIACRDCDHSAVHPVTVADIAGRPAAGSVWTFTRHCRECEHWWPQDGQRMSN